MTSVIGDKRCVFREALSLGDTLKAEELDREPELKLGPAANAIERREQSAAEAEGREYEPLTQRGARVHGAAAQLAAAMGADVTVFGTSRVGLRRFQALAAGNVCCMIQERGAFEQAVLEADLVIGAVLISTYDTPALMDEALVRRMKPGAVIVDVTCGYGAGYMPTFDRLTTHDSPVYERFGVLHCKIDAMPASVPLTATEAMSTTALPYVLALAEDIFCGKSDGVSRAGLVTADGAVLHPEILRHIELERARTGTPRRTEKEEASA